MHNHDHRLSPEGNGYLWEDDIGSELKLALPEELLSFFPKNANLIARTIIRITKQTNKTIAYHGNSVDIGFGFPPST